LLYSPFQMGGLPVSFPQVSPVPFLDLTRIISVIRRAFLASSAANCKFCTCYYAFHALFRQDLVSFFSGFFPARCTFLFSPLIRASLLILSYQRDFAIFNSVHYLTVRFLLLFSAESVLSLFSPHSQKGAAKIFP